MKNFKKVQGFTMIEMLAVVAIIGILASITLPNLSGSREKARDSERIAELGELAISLEVFYSVCKAYPSGTSLTNTSNATCPTGANPTLGDYINVPTDPQGGAYAYGTNGSSYRLMADLERDNAALTDDADSAYSVDCTDATVFHYCVGR